MIKLELDEFLFEIKDEFLSYQEIDAKNVQIWEEKFMKWIKNDTIKKDNVETKDGLIYYLIDDESEIFDMADMYYYAVMENKTEEYFEKFN